MTIRRSTRKNVLDWVSVERTAWSGRLEEDQFLARIFDLDKMPSHDGRLETAAGDIWQHRVNNNDGPDDWVFTDSRFNLLGCPDETFLPFLTEMLHPVVRPTPLRCSDWPPPSTTSCGRTAANSSRGRRSRADGRQHLQYRAVEQRRETRKIGPLAQLW